MGFLQRKKKLENSDKGKYYSVNESNKYDWIDKKNNLFFDTLIKEKYGSRWVGSLVADAHRTLIKGGFFSYPANIKNKNGKIRLLYEAYPFSYIFNVAGGFSLNGKEHKFLLEVLIQKIIVIKKHQLFCLVNMI